MPPGNGAGPEQRLRLGGMALRNGLLIHGPHTWAAAARRRDGRIEVSSGPKPAFSRGRLGSTPLLRGPLRLAEAFAVVPDRPPRPARRPAADRGPARPRRRAGHGRWRAAASAGSGPPRAPGESVVAALGVLPALTALRDRDLAAYHGVEHKAIGAYERGSFDPADAPKEHERCGSNLIVPLLVLSTAGQLIVERLFSRPGPVARAVAAVGERLRGGGAVRLRRATAGFGARPRHPRDRPSDPAPRLDPRAHRRAARGRVGRAPRGASRRGRPRKPAVPRK